MRALLLSLLIPSLAAAAPDKPPREPRCLAVEPASLRTSLAKPIPGARLTVLIPAREDDLGIVHLSKEEFAATGLSWDKFRRDAEAAAAPLFPPPRLQSLHHPPLLHHQGRHHHPSPPLERPAPHRRPHRRLR